jgi:hypothetical protein
VLGAIVGTLLDGIHAYGDVLTYDQRSFGRWAWFVPLEFGLLALVVGLAVPLLERAGGGEPSNWSAVTRLAELALFAVLYAVTALLGDDAPVAVAAALGALAVGRLVFDGADGDWLYVGLAALLGPAGEAALVALGPFEYLEPDVAGIPVWLPALWANGGFLVRRLIVPVVAEERRRKEPLPSLQGP